MKMTIAGQKLNFHIGFVLLYIVLLMLLLKLGFWQLGRVDEKTTYLEQQQISATKERVELSALLGADMTSLQYRQVIVSGQYDREHQFLIDNQVRQGQAGYFVMTPLLIDHLERAVLVNRGWIRLNKDRRILPELALDVLHTTVTGRVNTFPSVGLKLAGAEIPTESWPAVVQVVDSGILSEKLGYPLLPFQIELDASMNEGYERDWMQQKVMISPAKHFAYALQWFGLALTLTVLFIIFSIKNK